MTVILLLSAGKLPVRVWGISASTGMTMRVLGSEDTAALARSSAG